MPIILIATATSSNVQGNEKLLKSNSIKRFFCVWPDDVVTVLVKAFDETNGIHEGTYIGRYQVIGDTILKETGKLRSTNEIKRKLRSFNMI